MNQDIFNEDEIIIHTIYKVYHVFLLHKLTHIIIAYIFIKIKTALKEYVINICVKKIIKLKFKKYSSF